MRNVSTRNTTTRVGGDRPINRLDPFTLMVGIFSVVIGVGLLWTAFVAPLNPALFKIAVPLGLIVFGALGLALSRNR